MIAQYRRQVQRLLALLMLLNGTTACVPLPRPSATDSAAATTQPAGLSARIHRIALGPINCFLIESAAGLVLVDAGLPMLEQPILDKMAEIGRDDLRLIFITHAHIDHYGSAADLRRRTGALIAVHRADAEAMARGATALGSVRHLPYEVSNVVLPWIEPMLTIEPTPADILLGDGDRLDEYGIDAFVMHTPGHTLGLASLILEDRVAFVGDLIAVHQRGQGQSSFADDWAVLANNLARLQQYVPELVFTGHGHRPLTNAELQQLYVPESAKFPSILGLDPDIFTWPTSK
ncbi:MAG: MBL fold metallo-hydrolase [Caldilineaceae bacterium]|nr:MBL fold metallo-hydrolase [Caldilineaceae bacterium]MCB0142837.1 MBL fold metallo-hydrolase [Caldilineaceae bacterium]